MDKIINPDRAMLDRVVNSLERDFDEEIYPFLGPKGHLAYFKKKLLQKFIGNEDSVLYIVKNRGAIAFIAFFLFLKWDTDIFGFKIGRFEHIFMRTPPGLDSYKFLNEVMNDIKSQGYMHTNCRVGLKDYYVLNALENSGFYLTDIQLTLCTPDGYKASGEAAGKFAIRSAVAGDLEHLQHIVKDGFTDTRFVNDRRYPKDGVDKMYSEWIRNTFSDPSKQIFVAEQDHTGTVVGFLMGGIDADGEECLGRRIGFFELAAISKDHRNHGIFQMLIKHFVAWFKEKDIEKVEARTQLSNTQALRALMRGGLSDICINPTQADGVTMHHWF